VRTVTRKPANHGLHLFLTLITFGCWLPVWAVVALIGRRETVTVPDTPQHAYAPTYYHEPNPPSWRAGDPQTMLYAGAYYRWNPWNNQWERSYG
jgi:hypothetical protein